MQLQLTKEQEEVLEKTLSFAPLPRSRKRYKVMIEDIDAAFGREVGNALLEAHMRGDTFFKV